MYWVKPLLLPTLIALLGLSVSFAQDPLPQARTAFHNGDCRAATQSYAKAAQTTPLTGLDHDNYLTCLLSLNETTQADKYLLQAFKAQPDRVELLAERYWLALEITGDRKAQKRLSELLLETRDNHPKAQRSAARLLEMKGYRSAKKFLNAYRDRTRQPSALSGEFAAAALGLGETQVYFEEQLGNLRGQYGPLEDRLAQLQQPLDETGAHDILERALLTRQQREPGERFWVQALGWLYVQQLRFDDAFQQYRSLDRRFADQGPAMLQLAEMAQANGKSEPALRIAEYVADTYRTGPLASQAATLKISLLEQRVMGTYPAPRDRVEQLVKDYERLAETERDPARRAQYQLRIAELKGRYLGKVAEARGELTALQNSPRTPLDQKAEARLLLGDLDLVAGEPWEAALRYAQVEKDFHQHPLGYEAKLRGARLAYYRGDFELARSHLRVLKDATSRRIANDALELYLLVVDHAMADIATGALRIFARTDLQLFLHQDEEALATLDSLQNAIGAHPLQDDIRWRRAGILERMGKLQAAQAIYEDLADNYGGELYGDDALLALGILLEEKLSDPQGAMAAYKRLLIEHPGSSLGAEARRRFRALRGDILK